MFSFSKKKKNDAQDNQSEASAIENHPTEENRSDSFLKRLKKKLTKTRSQLTEGLMTVLLGEKEIDEDLLEALETVLLSADVGIDTTETILASLNKRIARKEVANSTALLKALKQALTEMLLPCANPLEINTAKPFIVLMVGINGAGKTTSIAKLAHYYQQHGKSVMLAAGDTFRAAAVEQLAVWAERNHVPIVRQKTGSDSASVIYDAVQSATAKNMDLLIADTAGRLHTQSHLMAELAKIKRVMQKLNAAAPHETLLVLDASTGQNALNQAKQFHKEIGLTGVAITKLDGTARGGVIFSIANELKLPIRFIGVGEQLDDLQPFDAKQFVEAIFE